MTLWGWDASHYDGTLTPAILARAKAEGIAFFTHKLGEGLSDTEGTMDDTALGAARSAGIEFLGGYLVPRSNATVAAQVDEWLALADAGEPWWHTFPGWFWQIDLERWSYDNVPASVGIACAQEIRRRTGRWTILYASHGQYWDELAAWDGPLWNADYVGSSPAGIAAMYPGDGWTPLHSGTWRGGWAPYSGQEPTFLQFTSSATIAGLTTCDGNAFRGTVEQLRALITGVDMALTDQEHQEIIGGALSPDNVLHFRLRQLQDADDPALADYYDKQGWEKRPGLKQVIDQVAAVNAAVSKLTPGQPPTQDQVNTAVSLVMSDPAWLAKLGAAVASHIHVS